MMGRILKSMGNIFVEIISFFILMVVMAVSAVVLLATGKWEAFKKING